MLSSKAQEPSTFCANKRESIAAAVSVETDAFVLVVGLEVGSEVGPEVGAPPLL